MSSRLSFFRELIFSSTHKQSIVLVLAKVATDLNRKLLLSMIRGTDRCFVHSWGKLASLRNCLNPSKASPVAPRVKNLPAMRETQEIHVWFLGWEDLLEKEMTTHSSSLAWEIPWIEEQATVHGGAEEPDMTEGLSAAQYKALWALKELSTAPCNCGGREALPQKGEKRQPVWLRAATPAPNPHGSTLDYGCV